MLPRSGWPSQTVALNGTDSPFGSKLSNVDERSADRWLFVAYDQLNEALFEPAQPHEGTLGLVFIESMEKAHRRPYHQQKLAFLLANMRHFALEMATHHPVLYLSTNGTYGEALTDVFGDGPVMCLEPAERELRMDLEPMVTSGQVEVLPHLGWLTPHAWFVDSVGTEPPFRMDAFYRKVRNTTGWLMMDGQPMGGSYSHDGENRKPWKGEPQAPTPPTFTADSIDLEVAAMVQHHYGDHPGRIDLTALPTTREQARASLAYGMACLRWFGPFEDAMSERSRSLFHTRLAPLMNLHRVMPIEAATAAMATNAPLNSVEGFVRQLIWREYVHHVHVATDGFRTLDVQRTDARRGAGWGEGPQAVDGGHPNHLGQLNPLFPAYWGAPSGLRCLDANVAAVMEDGWTHHIPRLMVLSNLANLLDINPRELTDWFHAAFIDAFDWVVEPNVLGMGTFALGTAMMTKPYVSGSAYIHRMSDHCGSCAFHPKNTCPITRLYWAYLNRHRPAFEGNHRMSMAMRNAAKRSDDNKAEDVATFLWVRDALRSGSSLLTTEGGLRSFNP